MDAEGWAVELAGQGVHDAPGGQKQQALEKRVGREMEHAGGIGAEPVRRLRLSIFDGGRRTGRDARRASTAEGALERLLRVRSSLKRHMDKRNPFPPRTEKKIRTKYTNVSCISCQLF
jgi:hypothetical protein